MPDGYRRSARRRACGVPGPQRCCGPTDARLALGQENRRTATVHAEAVTMCGRYASFLPPEAVARFFRTTNALPNIAPSWNVAPSQEAMVIRRHPGTGDRHLDLLQWGLLPYWTKEPAQARRLINARAETAATSPMFRQTFAKRRALVPAGGLLRVAQDEDRETALRHRAQRRCPPGLRGTLGRLPLALRGDDADLLRHHDCPFILPM